jgi:hypothetical protein
MGFLMDRFIDSRIEHHLGNPIPVPQVHKYDAAMVSAALHPAHEHHFFPHIFGAQFPASVGFPHLSQII